MMPAAFVAGVVLLLSKFIAFGIVQGLGPLRIKTQLLSAPGTALVICGLIVLLPRFRFVMFLSVNALLSLLLAANLWYLRFFHAPMTWDTFLQAGNARGLEGSIWSLVRWHDLFFVLDLLVVAIFWRGLGRRRLWRVDGAVLFGMGRKSFACAAVVTGLALHTVAGIKESRFRARPYLDLSRDNSENIVKLTAPLFYLIDGKIWLTEWFDGPPAEEELVPGRDWFAAKKRWQKGLSQWRGAPEAGSFRGRNLIMIQLEAFERALIHLRIGGIEVTPWLNRLVERGLLFNGVRTQVAHGNTSDAELLALTSLYPVTKGSAYFRFPHNRYRALPSLFRERGYQTVVFHGNRASFWSRSQVYPGMGFDDFVSQEKLGPGRFIAMGIDDFSFLDQVLERLQTLQNPFFALVITLSSHLPFVVPPELVEPEFNAVLPVGQLGAYLRSVHYADAALGQFIAKLNATSLAKESVIFAYGDHEGLQDSGRQAIADPELRRRFLENAKRVPALLVASGLAAGVVEQVGGMIDFLPTIAHLFGLSLPRTAMGTSLFLDRPGFALQPLGDGEVGTEFVEPKGLSPVVLSEFILRACRHELFCGARLAKSLGESDVE